MNTCVVIRLWYFQENHLWWWTIVVQWYCNAHLTCREFTCIQLHTVHSSRVVIMVCWFFELHNTLQSNKVTRSRLKNILKSISTVYVHICSGCVYSLNHHWHMSLIHVHTEKSSKSFLSYRTKAVTSYSIKSLQEESIWTNPRQEENVWNKLQYTSTIDKRNFH